MSCIRDPISRIRNARQSDPASRPASALKHEVGVCGHGGHIPRRYLGGPGGEYRLSEVPFGEIRNARQCEAASRSTSVLKHGVRVYRRSHLAKCAIRGSPRAHPILLLSSNMKWTYAITVDMPIMGISEGPGVNIAYWRSQFTNAQCEAVIGRIPLCSCIQTRSGRMRSRRIYPSEVSRG